MSTVKFGNRKFGRFKWGQPNKFYLYENLMEYLPEFVNRDSVFLKGFFRALAIVLLTWHRAVFALKTYHLSGMPGLKYINENWKIFVTEKTTDSEILNLIKTVYKIHQARGTQDGILADLKRVTGDGNANYEYYDELSCGWWLDITFPEISTDGFARKYNETATYLDLDNMLFLKFYNYSGRIDRILINIIISELIPVVLNTQIVLLKPLTLKWGRFKFGLKKFGQIIYPH